MSYQPLLMSGIILGKSGGGMSIGTPITGADSNAILTTDSAGKLSDKVLTSGQILIGSTGAAPVPATLTGTLNQILISSNAGSITLSLPQNIGTSSNVTFGSVSLQPSGSLDTTSAGTLAIGTVNASIINIGNSGSTVNIPSLAGFLKLDGSLPMTGNLLMGGHRVEGVSYIEGTTANSDYITIKSAAANGGVWLTGDPSEITGSWITQFDGYLQLPGIYVRHNLDGAGTERHILDGSLIVNAATAINLQANGAASISGATITLKDGPVIISNSPGVEINAPVNMENHQISFLSNGTAAGDAVNKGQLDAGLAGKQPVGNYVTALTGDVTASGPGSAIATLATVNAAPGTTGSASTTSTITTNAKGLVTSNTSVPIQIAQTQVTNLVSNMAAETSARIAEDSTFLKLDGSRPMQANLDLDTNGLSNVAVIAGYNGSFLDMGATNTQLGAGGTGSPNELQLKGSVIRIYGTEINAGPGKITNLSNGTDPTDAVTFSQLKTSTYTTVTGLLKGNGTTISAAVAGTDYQSAGNYITALTGDITASGPGSAATTLATVNASPGTFGSVSSVNTLIVNTKGLVTSIVNSPIQITESQVTNLVSDLAGKQPVGNYITSITGDATASGPGASALTLATVNSNTGTFNNVTVNAKGLVTAASNVAYTTVVTGDITPGSFSGLVNNTANQSITGLSFATTVSTFEALLNIQVSATTNTFTTVKIFGTRRASGTWTGASISPQFMGDSITGLSFGITAAGIVTISVGAITGFTSGIIKYRALSLT